MCMYEDCLLVYIDWNIDNEIYYFPFFKQILSSRDNNLFIAIFYSLKYLYPGIS